MNTYENFTKDPRYIYKTYKLNLDKVNSVDDCKKILKFLCDMYLQPISIDYEYNGFGDVAEYFER